MLTRNVRLAAAVLSGVTASLLVGATTTQAQERPVVVYGQPDENMRTERISYADLDLAQLRDQQTLQLRVAGAVKRVCLFDDSQAGLPDRGYFDCASGAKEAAAPQIAKAVERAKQIALTGQSSIAATAITISVPAS